MFAYLCILRWDQKAAPNFHAQGMICATFSLFCPLYLEGLQRAGELPSKEAELHDPLDPEAAKVSRGKRLLLLEEILNEIGFPDKNLAKNICSGFRLTGWLRFSQLFPYRSKPPQYSADEGKRVLEFCDLVFCYHAMCLRTLQVVVGSHICRRESCLRHRKKMGDPAGRPSLRQPFGRSRWCFFAGQVGKNIPSFPFRA